MSDLRVEDLHFSYKSWDVLKGISFSVTDSRLAVLLGASGSGKTTILKCIAQLLRYDTGRIYIGEEEITGKSPQELNVGYVPQGQILFSNMSVARNIEFGMAVKGVPREERTRKVKEIADLLGVSMFLERKPRELSGGQKQRVAIARALAIQPHLLLLDEPLASVDAFSKEALALEIKRVQQETGTTTVYVTHDQTEARLVADQVVILSHGKIVQDEPLETAVSNPSSIEAAILMGIPNSIPVKQLKEEILAKYKPKTGVIIPFDEIRLEPNRSEEDSELRILGKIVKVTQDIYQNPILVLQTDSLTTKPIRLKIRLRKQKNFMEAKTLEEINAYLPHNKIRIL